MKCYICKKDGAKRNNIFTDEDFKQHCACDECMKEIVEEFKEG